ncbi:hypothetical protein [Brevundimonas sp.]|uniref:hypothetical protein n=1 Tax=Brevundimonas sp. TaxID=1871086 RepID=UPI00391A118D
MEMQMNRTMISRSSAFVALAVATASLPVQSASATVSNTVMHHMSSADWQAMRETAGWSRLRSKLVRWKHLPSDWDGNDGVAPSCDTTDACSAFLEELQHVEAPLPEAMVAGDGEVSYEWSKGEAFASASFTADGAIFIFLRETEKTIPLRLELSSLDLAALNPFFQRIGAFA